MRQIQNIEDMRSWRRENQGQVVGFVPTMGALHAGHVSLVQEAKRNCDRVVVSIFVNPTQFDDPNDLQHYPQQLSQDLETLRQLEVDIVFTPIASEIYFDRYRYKISESELSRALCGAHRPGHFDGVLTVVLKLLLITTPDIAYFGEKDYQQYLLVRDMAAAFFMETKILSQPTVRESDGLAMSSRNVRLSPEERALAPMLYKTLREADTAEGAREQLVRLGFEIDYVEEKLGRRLAAVRLGSVRLIDNVAL